MSVKVAIVAGPDAGHAFPAFGLAQRLGGQGFSATVFTGDGWFDAAAGAGIDIAELPGLRLLDSEDDSDAGAKLSARAARMAVGLAPVLATRGVDLVVSDVITVAGLWAAELCGVPGIELSPHPLYLPSRGLPPIGAGLARGTGLRGRLRDAALRAASNSSVRLGHRQRDAARRSIGLGPASEPAARMVATLPALEVARPDWPRDTHLIGPLFWEPTTHELAVPDGPAPLIVVAPSTAVIGAADMLTTTLTALRAIALTTPLRVAVSALATPDDIAVPSPGMTVVAGLGRQDALLRRADLVVCGGGHGMLAKSVAAGVPVVTIPGGGDQWELANRVARQGSGVLVRPVSVDAVADAVTAVLADDSYTEAARVAAASGIDVVDPGRVVTAVVQRARRARTASSSTRGVQCD